jgi:DNA-binding GntR family transcriptional regulator
MLIRNTEKLGKRTLCERIYEEVVRLIMAGEPSSGGWVDEKRVIDKLCVSRTPFREAIGILAKGGLVEIKPYRGFYLRSLSRRETADLYELFKRLECFAVELAIQRMSDHDIRRPENILIEAGPPCNATIQKHMPYPIANSTRISPSNPEIPRSSNRRRGLPCRYSSVARSQA